VFKTKYARNAFDRLNTPDLNLRIRLDVKVGSEREAIKAMSIGGGQGLSKCNCNGKCNTKVCSCKKNGLFCNSRCHGGNNQCANK
jgi:hypothetical protein